MGCLMGVYENDIRNGTYEIPVGVTELARGAFQGLKSLKYIVIPGRIKVISDAAFRDCTSLESVVIEEGVEEICSEAFMKCHKLKNVQIPSTLKNIDWWAFNYCQSLSSVEIPRNCTYRKDSFYHACNVLVADSTQDEKTMLSNKKDNPRTL